ncbi:hypothetical protein [Methylococcus sp. EFPC2]|uniref:hypothetical protein n=1 Tax=Methylococcus sp. EFPC2 TaxID=2812648 RepID=UPI001967746A|nr:hypothetical protein [Methylococcus sp. EFPC2]QSA97282.1 hypothetical protein JWZ97_00050 [Methylococcus sp. EFPC2]
MAAEWHIKGAYTQELQHDDNIGMRTGKTEVYGTVLRPSFDAGWRDGAMNIGINGTGEVRRYDDDLWDCETFGMGMRPSYQGRKHEFSLTGGYSQSCTYTQQATDTGILLPKNQSENYNLAPAWSWQWSARDQFTVGPSYSQTDYISTGAANGFTSTPFQGNKTYGINLSEMHRQSPRLSLTGSTFYSHSSYTGAHASSQDVFGFQLGAQYQISRAWSINGSAGGRWVESQVRSSGLGDSHTPGTPQFGELANIALSHKGKYATSSVTFSRTVNPSAFGQVTQYTSVSARYSYPITRHLSWSLDGSYQQNESASQSSFQTRQNRTFFSASSGLTWQFAKHWRLSGNYRYRRQEYDSIPGVRDSNAVTVDISYDWDGLREAR